MCIVILDVDRPEIHGKDWWAFLIRKNIWTTQFPYFSNFRKKLLKFYLANVIILMIPKTSSSPMNAAWIAAKMTSTRSTYVCHKMRYSVPSTAGILSTIDTNTPIIRSVRFPFCAEMYNFFKSENIM